MEKTSPIFTGCILALMLASPSAFGKLPEMEDLFLPFTGFHKNGMKQVYALFRADPQGRVLLRKSWKKLGMKGASELNAIFCYCSEEELGGVTGRRGLFIQQSDTYYRAVGEDEWRQESTGGLERLNDPETWRVVAEKRFTTRNFEYLNVAFMPKICVKKGLTVLQTYLVLYHELTHLAGLDPFHKPDLFSFYDLGMEDGYYFKQLEKPGGEMDAYLAQMDAFRRLKEHYELPVRSVLEEFLSDNGRLLGRDKPAFLSHLLYDAGYQKLLDKYLSDQVLYQYNRAQSWWAYLGQYLEQLESHHAQIEAKMEKALELLAVAREKQDREEVTRLEEARKQLVRAKAENRRVYARFKSEQKRHIDLMVKLDEYYPED